MTTEIDVKPSKYELVKHKSRVELTKERLNDCIEKGKIVWQDETTSENMASHLEAMFKVLDEIKLYRDEMEKYIELLEGRLKHFDETIII